MAIILHTFLNIVAVVIAFYIGERIGHWEFGILFLAVSLCFGSTLHAIKNVLSGEI